MLTSVVILKYITSPIELEKTASKQGIEGMVPTDTVPNLLASLKASRVYMPLVEGSFNGCVCIQNEEKLRLIKEGTELIASISPGKLKAE